MKISVSDGRREGLAEMPGTNHTPENLRIRQDCAEPRDYERDRARRVQVAASRSSKIIRLVRFLALLLFPGLFPIMVLHAQTSVSLAWNASASADVAGYNVYYGTASGQYTQEISVGDVTSVTVSNLAPGLTYYFSVTTLDTSGLESAPSGEVSYAVPALPVVPGMVLQLAQTTISGTTYSVVTGSGVAPPQWTIEYSFDLIAWAPLAQGVNIPVSCWVVDENYPRMFFRLLNQ